jgi:hypothetical protein
MFGGTPARNMVNLDEKLTAFPLAGPNWDDDKAAKPWEDEWVLWQAHLGSRSYGGPDVAGGKVFVGTNNERPRNGRDIHVNKAGEAEPSDKGILMCFDEKTGKFLWQAVHDKLPNGVVTDWREYHLSPDHAPVGVTGISWGPESGMPIGSVGLGTSPGLPAGTPRGSPGPGMPEGPGSGWTGCGIGLGTSGWEGEGVSDMRLHPFWHGAGRRFRGVGPGVTLRRNGRAAAFVPAALP